MLKKLAWAGSLSSLYTYFREVVKTEFIYKVLYWHFMTSGTSGMYLLLHISIVLTEMLSTPQEFLPNANISRGIDD